MKKILNFIPTILCLSIFVICLYLFFSFSRKTLKPKEVDYKVLSVSIDKKLGMFTKKELTDEWVYKINWIKAEKKKGGSYASKR